MPIDVQGRAAATNDGFGRFERSLRKEVSRWGGLVLVVALAACAQDESAADMRDAAMAMDAREATGGCDKDTDCKGDRICVDRQCVDPQGSRDGAPPDLPTMDFA